MSLYRSGRYNMGEKAPDFQHRVESSIELTEPPLFRVLLHNDNYTTMEFVVQILEGVFNKAPAEATRIMLNVHTRGVGVCGVYPAEVAETKVMLVHHAARENKFPLKCTMEEI